LEICLKTVLKEIRRECFGWVRNAQNRSVWLAVMNTAKNNPVL